MVEQLICNQQVVSSNLSGGSNFFIVLPKLLPTYYKYGAVAQLVERRLCKANVAGSTPVGSTNTSGGKMKKIAITLSRKAINYNSIFTNGIHQNIYTLQKMLRETGLYDVSLFYDYTIPTKPFEDGTYVYKQESKEQLEDIALLEQEKYSLYERYPHINVNKIYHRYRTTGHGQNILEDFDLIIEAGYAYGLPNIEKIRKNNPNIKIAFLVYGNMYWGALEKIIFSSNNASVMHNKNRDAVWLSPHFEEWLGWHKTVMNTPIADIAPYIWSPDFFENKINETLSLTRDTFSVVDKKNVAVLEPNMGFVKNCLTPVVTIENLYNRNSNAFDDAYIFNTDHFSKSESAKIVFSEMNIVKDKRISFSARYGLEQIFSKFASVLLSHQHCCALNYVFLEALYLNIPLVHNSPFFKEVGYYYEGFDVVSASSQLEKALENRRLDKVNGEKTEEHLRKYSPENPNNINGYIKLIEDILTK